MRKTTASLKDLQDRFAVVSAELAELRQNEGKACDTLAELDRRRQARLAELESMRADVGASLYAERLPNLHAHEKALQIAVLEFDEFLLKLEPLARNVLAADASLRGELLELAGLQTEYRLSGPPPTAWRPEGLQYHSIDSSGLGQFSGGLGAFVLARLARLRRDKKIGGGL